MHSTICLVAHAVGAHFAPQRKDKLEGCTSHSSRPVFARRRAQTCNFVAVLCFSNPRPCLNLKQTKLKCQVPFDQFYSKTYLLLECYSTGLTRKCLTISAAIYCSFHAKNQEAEPNDFCFSQKSHQKRVASCAQRRSLVSCRSAPRGEPASHSLWPKLQKADSHHRSTFSFQSLFLCVTFLWNLSALFLAYDWYSYLFSYSAFCFQSWACLTHPRHSRMNKSAPVSI